MVNFLDQLWSGDAIGDGAVGVYLLAAGGVAVYKAREAVVPHDAGPSVCTYELPDHALRDLDRTVDDVVLADRVHAADGQAVISVDACSGSHGRFERIALFARQALVVAGCVHIEMPVQQVVDVRLLGCELLWVDDGVAGHGAFFLGLRCPGPPFASGVLAAKVGTIGETLVRDLCMWRSVGLWLPLALAFMSVERSGSCCRAGECRLLSTTTISSLSVIDGAVNYGRVCVL